MTTVYTRSGLGHALTWQNMDDNINNLNTAKLEHIVSDLTPQLGADLDINTHSIISTSNGNINITPNGTGIVSIKGVKFGPGAGNITTNTAGGNLALNSNTTGNYNTALGYAAMQGNTNANYNTALGYGSLWRNANTHYNTAVGYHALNNSIQSGNTAIGYNAGAISDTGLNNTFIGYSSGSALSTGSNNVIIGSNTASSISGTDNNILISDGSGNIRLSFDSTGAGNINSTLTVDKLQIDTSVTSGSTSVGLLAWNDLDGTLEFQAKGGNVTVQIGQEQLIRIHNNIGSTLTDGQVVYINGSTGERPTVALASASAELTSVNTIGIVTEPITNGSDGFITTIGLVHSLNTNAYNEGDAIWLSTTAGTWTTTRPTAPNHSVFIGWVVKKSAGNGSIFVHIQNGYELEELHNVLISSVTNNQFLKYNSTSSVWENTSIKTINGNSIIGSGDITVSGGSSSGFEQTFLLMGA